MTLLLAPRPVTSLIGDDIPASVVEPAVLAQLAGYPDPTGDAEQTDVELVLCQFKPLPRPHSGGYSHWCTDRV